MPTLPSEVQPGDIISSELMTEILSRLSQLSDAVLTGTQSVPNLIGLSLTDARTLIQQPSLQLALGFVVDAHSAEAALVLAAGLLIAVGALFARFAPETYRGRG